MNIVTTKTLKHHRNFAFVATILATLLTLMVCLSSANAQVPGRYAITDNQGTTTANSFGGYLVNQVTIDGDISFTLSDVLDQKRFNFLLKVNSSASTGQPGALKGILIDDHGHYGAGNRNIEIIPLPDGGKRVIFSRIAAKTVHYPQSTYASYWKGFAYITMDFNPFNFLNRMTIDFIRAQPVGNPFFVEGRICDLSPPVQGYLRLRKER